MVKTKIAVLVSGGGTNLQALLDAQQSGLLTDGEIVLVIASNAKAYALTRAAQAAGRNWAARRPLRPPSPRRWRTMGWNSSSWQDL